MVAHMSRLCRSILRPALVLLPPAQAGDLPPARRQGPWSPVVFVARLSSLTIDASYDPEDVGNRPPRATQSRASAVDARKTVLSPSAMFGAPSDHRVADIPCART